MRFTGAVKTQIGRGSCLWKSESATVGIGI